MSGPARTPIEVKLARRLDTSGDCWLWTGAEGTSGYGNLNESGRGGKTRGAHDVALELATGELANGRLALHSCDVKLCCRPAHLRWGTKSDNAKDAVARGQHFTPFRRYT